MSLFRVIFYEAITNFFIIQLFVSRIILLINSSVKNNFKKPNDSFIMFEDTCGLADFSTDTNCILRNISFACYPSRNYLLRYLHLNY